MKKPLRIAIYTGEIPSTTFIERLIIGLANSGEHVFLFGAIKKNIEYVKGVTVMGYRPDKISKLLSLFKYACLLFFFKRKQKRRLDVLLNKENRDDLYTKVKYYPVLWAQPDVFHVQWAKGLDDWMWVQDFGMKLVLSLRGAHINYSPIADITLAYMYRKNFPKLDGFHAVSEAIAMESQKYGANQDVIRVIKSGLDLNAFTFQLKDFDLKSSLKIISVGRDHWKKDYRTALDAMVLLKQSGIPFQYQIIGIGNSEALLFQRTQLGLEKEICFLETMPFELVKDAIQKADVLVLPSVEEGIANVVLEAMALGTLVVSTDCGGMSEVVVANQTGFLVPIRDAHKMASALQQVIALKKETYHEITEQARVFVEKHHSQVGMVAVMRDLYQEAKYR